MEDRAAFSVNENAAAPAAIGAIDDSPGVSRLPDEPRLDARRGPSPSLETGASPRRSGPASATEAAPARRALAPPVFPVTPRILDESERNDEADDDEEDGNEARAGRPFGPAEDPEPSEIQKMYRSRPIATATILPEGLASPPSPVAELATARSTGLVEPRDFSNEASPVGDDAPPPITRLRDTTGILNGNDDRGGAGGGGGGGSSNVDGARASSRPPPYPSEIPGLDGSARRDARRERNATAGSTGRPPPPPSPPPSPPPPPLLDSRNVPPLEYLGYPRNSSFFLEAPEARHRPRRPPPAHAPDFRESIRASGEVVARRREAIATRETALLVACLLGTLVVLPILVGLVLLLGRFYLGDRKVLRELDASSKTSRTKDALDLENGGGGGGGGGGDDSETSIEKAVTKLPRIQRSCHEPEKAPSPLPLLSPPPLLPSSPPTAVTTATAETTETTTAPQPPGSRESHWEFPRDKLRLRSVLGRGNFGQVWKAEADDPSGREGATRLVAVKTVKEGASAREKEELLRELGTMQRLGRHPNVVTLLGCCTDREPSCLILEYVAHGKLLTYLRDRRASRDFCNFSEDSAALTSRDLTVFGYCVARGMEYLASKRIIHRDLAARNVLVDRNKLCKIADFGMSRFANEEGRVVEARRGRSALPVRWMAPESLVRSLFTTKSDVWSFGVLAWEIVTLGSTPYPDMTAREVARNVRNGYRLRRPSHCRTEFFRVASRCWRSDPERRPEFPAIRRQLARFLEDDSNGRCVDLDGFLAESTDD